MASPPFNRKEFVSRLGKSSKGRKLSAEHKKKISNWNKKHNWKPPHPGKREKCRLWKGGRKIDKQGYILLYKPEHPMARKDGYILEHRFVAAKKEGRLLKKNEVVHHIDGNIKNNKKENLEVYKSSGQHIKKNHMKKDKKTGKFISHNSPL